MNITRDMSIIDIVQKFPQTVEIFRNHGMGCLGCAAARFENLEQGANAHGIDVEKLLTDLNAAVSN